MAGMGCQSYRSTRVASSTVVNATTAPTERSMPPVRITKVMPVATTSKKALSIRRFRNTCGARKPSYLRPPASDSATNSDTVTASDTAPGSRR